MRKKKIRVSDTEHRLLTEYRNKEYGPEVPYGYVIADLLNGEEE